METPVGRTVVEAMNSLLRTRGLLVQVNDGVVSVNAKDPGIDLVHASTNLGE
jgi:hypothetical protein